MTARKQSKKRDAYTIVLEDIRSDFRAFGGSLDFVRDEVKGHSRTLQEQSRTLQEHGRTLQEIKEDLEILKAEVALIRHNQVTRDEFKFLETRVSRLERKLK